jgi:Na+/H+-dicarboxylate symporter
MGTICKLKYSKALFYGLAIILGVLCGSSNVSVLIQIGSICSEIFIRIFRFVSMPVIALSVIMALSTFNSHRTLSGIWRKLLFYTIGTTLIAATLSAFLYGAIRPQNVGFSGNLMSSTLGEKKGYLQYALEIIPDNFFSAFAGQKALSVLFISIAIGLSIRFIQDESAKQVVLSFFKGIHSILFTMIRFVVTMIPIGLFGFVTMMVVDLKDGICIGAIGRYFSVIILSNLIQGFIVLPLLVFIKKINPIRVLKAMFPALSFAFFSKSSVATLPLTIECAEGRLGLDKALSRFSFPLCSTINMNGCASFIFTTVIYLMQNNGVEITMATMFFWIILSTFAAIGNAGVPMGCFFMSVSLLSAMDIPVHLMGIILPIYGLIDMIETPLNVWSDICITAILDKKLKYSTQKIQENGHT